MADQLTLAQLKAAPLGLACPFSLDVPGGQALTCEQVLRHLPGRRVVFRSHWGGASVLVKLFFRKRDFERERTGLAAIREADIPCPPEVWALKDEAAECFLLATEFLEKAVSLQASYESDPPEIFAGHLRMALALTGRLHESGFMQSDIHLDNFLLQEGVLYMVDGGGIEPLRGPLDNLGLFFAQMTPDYDCLVGEVIDVYGANPPEAASLQSVIARRRERRIQHYLSKTVRNCTQFLVPKIKGAFLVVLRATASDRLLRLMEQPEAAMGQAVFLKRGNTATVVKVPGDNPAGWILKRYNIKDFWHGLSRCFRPSRAWISWRSAHRLELLGIATPLPLAMRENRFGPLRKEAYLLTECIEGDNLQAWLLRQGGSKIPDWLDREVSGLFEKLLMGRVSHGDMKATNLIVSGEKLYVIDLDGVQRHRGQRQFSKYYRKDLQRFMDNWQGNTWQHFEQILQPFAAQVGITLVNKKV